jgi:hypothetical protein
MQEQSRVNPTKDKSPPSGKSEEMRSYEDGIGESIMMLSKSNRKPRSNASIYYREKQQQAKSN